MYLETFEYKPFWKELGANPEGESNIISQSPIKKSETIQNNEQVNSSSEIQSSLHSNDSFWDNSKTLYIKAFDGKEYEVNQNKFLSHWPHLKQKFMNLSGSK